MIDKTAIEREIEFKPGFRLIPSDVAILIVGGVISFHFGKEVFTAGLIISFLIFHFFLFCNVLRMKLHLEIIWSVIYVALFTLCVNPFYSFFTWNYVFGISLISTIVLSIIQMKRVDYHGVFWEKINPKLHDWWLSSKAQKV